MVLAAEIESPDGRYRLPAGTVLAESHLKWLRGWHIREIEATPESTAQPQDVAASEPAATPEETIRQRFAPLAPEEPIVITLTELALARAETLAAVRPARPPAAGRQKLADVPTPEAILASDPVLVSLPEVFMRIREVLSDPNSTVEEASAVIGKDPSLTAKLLKLVNSAFYARTLRVSGGLPPGPVDTLSRAVMLLGLNQLSTLAMGVSVLPLFKDIPAGCIDLRQFWRHSIGVGLIAKLMAVRMHDPSPERFFVAGLLHDIGRLVLYKQVPAAAGASMAEAAATGRHLVEVEQELFGFNHAELGGMLLHKWRFPESLEQAVWRHHAPTTGEVPLEPAIICVADMIAGAVLPGSSGERLVPRHDPAAWNAVGMAPADLPELVETAEAHFEVICAMFA
ncbi:HDOD domain-containing protein [Desulfovibrio aerotolerans]|uniref:HDOD domain-containing protein n=2 Tax=Solidesulfovibrio aerotolerans TaxID=295255 RepID=A0A7C9IXY9_9BACT|nr:HDOD domain-containing protein [Solidesulfovibrio aerotolerans]